MRPSVEEIQRAKGRLRDVGWLSQCGQPFRDSMLSESHWIRISPGVPIALGAEVIGGMYGVAEGEFGLVPAYSTPDAGLIHIGRGPFWFGIQPFLTGTGRQVTAVARTSCVVAHVNQAALASILQKHPDGWRFLLKESVAQTAMAVQTIGDLLLADRFRRCGAVLLRLAGARNPNSVPNEVHCSHEELAAMCNLSRSSISSALKLFRKQKLIKGAYRSISIRDADRMRQMVDAC